MKKCNFICPLKIGIFLLFFWGVASCFQTEKKAILCVNKGKESFCFTHDREYNFKKRIWGPFEGGTIAYQDSLNGALLLFDRGSDSIEPEISTQDYCRENLEYRLRNFPLIYPCGDIDGLKQEIILSSSGFHLVVTRFYCVKTRYLHLEAYGIYHHREITLSMFCKLRNETEIEKQAYFFKNMASSLHILD